LIVGMMIMHNQVQFFKTKDLGYNDRQLIRIPTETEAGEQLMEVYRNELAHDPHVLNVSGSLWEHPTRRWKRKESNFPRHIIASVTNI
jgi:hypothetical protein